MRLTIKFLITVILTLGIISCSKPDKYPESIDFFEISRSDLIGTGEQGFVNEYIHITDSTIWKEFLNKFDSYYHASSAFSDTIIDFRQFDIIVAIDTPRKDAGYDIRITEIKEWENRVEVGIEKRRFGGALTTAQPYHVIKTFKIDKPIVFIEK